MILIVALPILSMSKDDHKGTEGVTAGGVFLRGLASCWLVEKLRENQLLKFYKFGGKPCIATALSNTVILFIYLF